ncbi:SSU ribosomal protein S1P [human gut metagenome]|uniref:SSU ribosomal protein S1P n=1 Tax=human gut metagenome TaxID=408170 RepID=K1UDX2_9ZZZZ
MSEEKLTMDDFSAELEASFKKIEEGDMLTGTVISVDEKEVILDLKYYAEGSSAPRTSATSLASP